MSSKPRVLSLIQPTAESFHIGNLLGAVQYWPGLMEANDCFYGVADLHAFTVQTDPEVLRQRTLLSIAQLVAAGCDPDRGAVFVQSHVPQHTELMWVFSCLTGFGEGSTSPCAAASVSAGWSLRRRSRRNHMIDGMA